MTRTTTYNLKKIMKKAWTLVKSRGMSMSDALKHTWADAKALIKAIADNCITEEVHTWFEWTLQGLEVIHNSVAVFKVTMSDAKTKSDTKVNAFFTKSQTCVLGTQEAK